MDYQTLINSKIYNSETLKDQLEFWRFDSKKICFTNGCFDILHVGHADYLSKAASFGDVLVIGLNSDNSIHRIKGQNRPINPQEARAFLLASLTFVDAVILFDDDTPYELIKMVQPDFLIKGNDYAPEQIVGYDIVKSYGGEIITIPLVDGFSTSSIIRKLEDKKTDDDLCVRFDWFENLNVAITVCDLDGKIISMNTKSKKTFEKWGGEALIGNSLMPCHSEKSQQKIGEMMANGTLNAYTIQKNGVKKLIYQCPWFKLGIQSGLVEFSLEIPFEMPHFIRE